MRARDLDFLLFEWLDVVGLTSRPEYAAHSRESFEAVLGLARKVAERDFEPHYQAADRTEPELRDGTVHVLPDIQRALQRYAEAGLAAAVASEALGGHQLPHVVDKAAGLWLQSANAATAAYPMLSRAAANLLIAYGSEELVSTFVPRLLDGTFFGTMCLSEPGAGSSLTDITTRAARANDGTYRVRGTKMWISGGDHELSENIIHLVLARTGPADLGVRALSLFAVPKYVMEGNEVLAVRNAVHVSGLNHKMGYRGTVNAVLEFGTDGGDGAVGSLIGEVGGGLAVMFHMMNEARIAVGAGAAALGYAGYLEAVAYARERHQGRLPGAQTDSPPVAIIQHADVRRMLVASKSYVEGAVALVLYAARLLDDSLTAESASARERADMLLDVLTPVVKSWPSQWALAANDYAIQVLGGAGYVRDHKVEQLYRDNRLNPIHEGTFGVQANDLLGRKVRMRNGEGLELLVDAIMQSCARLRGGALNAWAEQLARHARKLPEVTQATFDGRPLDTALSDAATYLELVGHLVVAWLWLEQAAVAGEREGQFYDGKRVAAQYFFERELPKLDLWYQTLGARDGFFSSLDDACL